MRVLEGRVGRLSWRALQPFGAEVEGDLSRPLTPEEAACLRKVFYDHDLIVARGQKLTLEQQQALAGHIGPVLANGRGMEYVSPDDGILNEAALTFHSDLAFAPEPFQALSLHAVDVAENRTSTRFANAHRAYERMRDGLKGRIAGMKAISMSVDLGPVRVTPHDVPANSIHQTWNVVRTHPVTGRKFLYVSESHTVQILGLSYEASEALLETLFEELYADDNRIEHVWRNGDVVLWDNLAVQHGRPDLTGVAPRRLQRAAVAEHSLVEQLPDFFERGAAGAPRSA
jgi:taurine dioxygenase